MARRRPPCRALCHRGFTIVELLVVVGLLALLVAILLPSLGRARELSMRSKMRSTYADAANPAGIPADAVQRPALQALVKSLDAVIHLTPRLATASREAESIYEAAYKATLSVARNADLGAGEQLVALPLPPEIISLADLVVTLDGKPSDAVSIAGGKLVWHGNLPDVPTRMEVSYTAMGKGLYVLETPNSRGLDRYRIELTTRGSDVRMLNLSTQPTDVTRSGGGVTYTWDYKNLFYGRPVAVDVLGIAPIDRLGELRWLGPMSVIAFGMVVGLFGKARPEARFDRWMLLLLIGTFTAAYPLMYFLQEFMPLTAAVALASAGVMGIIAVRSATILGPFNAVSGVVLPAAGTLAVTLLAAVYPQLQGLLLTIGSILLFILAMTLAPRIRLHPVAVPATH